MISGNKSSYLVGFIAVLMVMALLSDAYLSSLNRMMADDYCWAVVGLRHGAWGGMAYRYETWTGSYASSWLHSFLAPMQHEIQLVSPTLSMVVWVILTGVLLWQLMAWLNFMPDARFLLGIVIISTFVILNSLPTGQIFHWFSGLVRYKIPMLGVIGASILLVWLLREPRPTGLTVLAGLGMSSLVFVAGGMSETFLPSQIVAVGLLIVLVGWYLPARRRDLLPVLGIVMVSAVLALIITLIAPGNAIRQPRALASIGLEAPTPILELPFLVLRRTVELFVFDTYGMAHILFVFFGMLLLVLWRYYGAQERVRQLPYPKNVMLVVGIALGAMLLLVAATITPAMYVSQSTPARTMLLPRVIQVTFFAGMGYLMAVWLMRDNKLAILSQRPIFGWVRATLIGLMIFLPALALLNNLSRVPDYRTYAEAWDVQHAFILEQAQAGISHIEVEALPIYLEDALDLERVMDEDGFFMTCAVDFYEVQSIRVIAPPS